METLNLGPIFKLICNVCDSANCVLEIKKIHQEGLAPGKEAIKITSQCLICMAKEDKVIIIDREI
ncbi:MAG: hypothetical protein RR515_06195 [Clostridium sp.]